ncbi:MAG: 4Fe-4S dicluster domain-containing protein [Candidatus Hydrothermarchaeaceae archaeon]
MEIVRIKDCDSNFINEIIAAGGKNAHLCFSCGTCTGGCPASFAMDYTPRQVIRMAGLGMRDKVLRSEAVWYCVSCNTCNTRCPRGVEIPKVMAAIKSIAIKEGVDVNKSGPAFYTSFSEIVATNGKIFEPMLLLKFALRSASNVAGAVKYLIASAPLGIELIKKGKLHFTPDKIRGRKQLKRIYENVRKMEGAK